MKNKIKAEVMMPHQNIEDLRKLKLYKNKYQLVEKENQKAIHKLENQNERLLKELKELKQENNSLKSDYIKDIIELKLAEETLKESLKRYQSVVENVGEGIGLVNPDEIFVFANPAAERIFGVGKGELLGKNLKEFFSEKHYLIILNQTKIRKKGQSSNYENELTLRDGRKRNIIITAVPQYDDNEKFIGTYGIFRDITDSKKAEMALRKSEESYRLLVNSIPDTSIHLLDRDMRYQVVGGGELEKNNFDKSKVEGMTLREAFPKEVADTFEPLFSKALNGQPTTVEMEYGNFIYSQQILPVKNNEYGIFGVIQISVNITERKKSELIINQKNSEFLKLNVDKDRFISILSHDLRSPFNTILGFSNLLRDNIRQYSIDEVENLVNYVYQSALGAFNLLEDLLKWARTQSDKIPFEPQELSFTYICKNIVETLKPSADVKNIIINHLTSGDIIVFADMDMLSTVLRNLVSNAIKFTNKNGVINILAEKNPGNVTISVTDNGIGIAPNNIVKLFDISQIYSTPGTAEEEGTGLGLLLCKEFVVKHGGNIRVQSEIGKGTEFKFTLPQYGPEQT